MYHGKFNGQRFNSVPHPADILLRDIISGEAAGDAQITGRIDEIIPAECEIRQTAAVGVPVSAAVHGEGIFTASEAALLPVAFVTLRKRRGYNQDRFNRVPFDRGERTTYVHAPEVWHAQIDGVFSPMEGRIDGSMMGEEAFASSPISMTTVFPFSVPSAAAILASSPELLPTVPLGTVKTPHPSGFNHLPFDGSGAAAYTVQPVTWRGDFDGILPRMQGEIDGGAELSEALNADVFLILNCYVVWTADNGLNGGFDLKPTVYVGQIRIRRRGFNHGILNRNRFNLNFRDRYVRTPLTWSAQLEALPGVRIIVKGGELDAERLKAILDCTGFPVAYNHFISAPTLPFIVYMRVTSPNYFADNRVFRHLNRWNIYLCTELKSRATERKLEDVLDEFSIPYEVVDEVYIDDERLYQIIYQFEELEE